MLQTEQSHKKYFLGNTELRECSVMIDGRNIFDQHVKTDIRIYEKIRKVTTGQRVTTQLVTYFDYLYFKKKMQANRNRFK